MALKDLIQRGTIASVAELVFNTPHNCLWSNYDREADVLYINFEEPADATDSELTDDDTIVRYRGGEIIGVTILHASKRAA